MYYHALRLQFNLHVATYNQHRFSATRLDLILKPHEYLLVEYIPSSSMILMVVLLYGWIREILSVGDRSSFIFSVGSNAMSLSKILKLMAFLVSCG